MGIGLTSLFFLFSAFLPIVGFLFSLFIPLPVLFYRTKLGRKLGIYVPVGTLLLITLVLGRVSVDLLYFGGLLVLGFSLSEFFEKRLSVEATVVGTCGVVLISGLVGLLAFSASAGQSLLAFVSAHVTHNLEMTLTLYEKLGVSQDAITVVTNSMDQIRFVMLRILPALTIMSALFVCWVNLMAAKPVLTGRALPYPDFGPLNHWRAPEQVVWVLIGSGLIMLLPSKGVKLVGVNGLLVVLTIYFFQGMGIISFFFEKKQVPRFFRVMLYTLIALQQVLLLVVIGLGVFDLWLNFRKIGIKQE
ncbi:MAG: YybS family protein [Desulfosarcinaceae bacterium]|nr:YybS family protein [Desulfosarcinaceae bacterium]